MNNILKIISEDIQNEFEYSKNLRRDFHRYPEIAKEEYRTAEIIEKELRSFGISPKRVGETGVYAELKGEGKGEKTIVLRADIDAICVNEEHNCEYTSTIPGKMHACGHDAHTASLLTAAKVLCENKDKFGGTIKFIFQPGEEIGYGARIFVDQGYLKGADRCFGIHVSSNIPVGKISLTPGPSNAGVDWFKITVSGKAAHVSTPELGVDALYIASKIVTSAQAVATRMSNPMEPVLIGIGKMQAGTAYNVVAETAVLEGTIRTLTPESRSQIKEKLQSVAELTAQMYGGSVDIEWKDFTSPLINDKHCAEEAAKIAYELFGQDNVITNRQPSLGGDDFAEFIINVPGVYAFVGSGNDKIAETVVAHHNGNFDIDENSLTVAAKIYAAYTVEFLNNNV